MSDTGNEMMRWGDEIYREEERIKKDARKIVENVKYNIGRKDYDDEWGAGLAGATKYLSVDMGAIREEKTEEEVIEMIKRAEDEWRKKKFEALLRGEAKISLMMDAAKHVTGETGTAQLFGWLADLHETHYGYRQRYQIISDKYYEMIGEHVY